MRHGLVGFIFLTAIVATVMAVDRPPREYISPDELVTLAADLSIDEALDILSSISLSTMGKSIVSPEKSTVPIGVDIYHRHWRDALELVLARKQLWYIEAKESLLVFRPKLGSDGKPLLIPPGAGDPTRVTPSTREVKIEAVFFEGDCNTLREIGINWSSLVDGKLNIDGEVSGADELTSSILSLSIGGSGTTTGGTEVGVEALMRTLESFDKGHIIARPEVTVADRKTGRIQVGQDFSIKSKDYAGNTIEQFYSAGTILEVVPTIVFDEDTPYIHLDIRAERSTVTPDPISTTVNKTETETEVLLYDGEQTAIGGLYINGSNVLRKGIPVLKDLPWWVLGFRYIFGYSRDEQEVRELVILIRAHLMDGVSSRVLQQAQLEKERKEAFKKMQDRYK